MKILLITLISFLIQAFDPKSNPMLLIEACQDFNALNTKVRDNQITKKEALKQLQILLPKIKLLFYKNEGKDFSESNWVFPVQGYNRKAIGGTKGSGYIVTKYDYLDGNKHLGHPAHDIFIQDKNQDGIDDLAKKQVNILSMTGGVVVATDTNWNITSTLRGGKCIWIYDPYSNSLYYYAHNNKIFVTPGDIIKPGDPIATIGRTGVNAYKKRSPTHLHFMQLRMNSDYHPKPFDSYKNLIETK